jgi:hypothetical protein
MTVTDIEHPRHEAPKWTVRAEVAKWTPEQVAALGSVLDREPTPDELHEHFAPELVSIDGNMLLTAGLNHFMKVVNGAAGFQAIDNAHTRIGVGDSSAAEAANQTDLQGANKWFALMDSGYPNANTAGVLTARATFGSGFANFTNGWQEWGIDVSTANAQAGNTVGTTLINRKVATLGQKVSGAVWQFTVAITLSSS